MNRLFEKYGLYKGPIQGRQNGVLIAMGNARRCLCAQLIEERGVSFIAPGDHFTKHDHRRERQAA